MNNPPENGESAITMEVDNFYVDSALQGGLKIRILVPGATGTGTYPYGNEEKQAYIDFVSGPNLDDSRITQKRDCEFCGEVQSGGNVKITKKVTLATMWKANSPRRFGK